MKRRVFALLGILLLTLCACAPGRESAKPEKTGEIAGKAGPVSEPEAKDAPAPIVTEPDTGRAYGAERIVVRADPDAPQAELEALFEQNRLTVCSHLKSAAIYVLETEAALNGKQYDRLLKTLEESEYILEASRDYINEAQ